MLLHEDRLFSTNPSERDVARRLYALVKDLPLICPHGHTDPSWFADNAPFGNAAELMLKPDHYVLRMLCSQGITLESLGIPRLDGAPVETDPRKCWRLFAENNHLFRATPSRMWLDYTFQNLFGLDVPLSGDTADHYFDTIGECLASDEYRPRALFDSFRIEVIATTESPLDSLEHHEKIRDDVWQGRVITAYRPDAVVDPDMSGFRENLELFGNITRENTETWAGYLAAHRKRRADFAAIGATSTDHGHPTAQTADLSLAEAEALYEKVRTGVSSAAENELFRAQMLTEMAGMSIDDGLVMQLHPGSLRNHSTLMLERFGRDKGFDIPRPVNFVEALHPLLERYGMNPNLSLILFTLDETTYSRELAPLAGVYPSVKLGPAWWFFDSAAGMMRYRELVTETAGFYNTVGFNDDTRAFPSIPARHDVARRVDCAFLADQVCRHLINEEDAADLAYDLTYGLAKKAYRL